MSATIISWLGGDDTGSSSKAMALTALGQMPRGADGKYPSDGADFGRCYRLLQAAPEAKAGLDELGRNGGPYWKALAARWAEIEAAYLSESGKQNAGATYELMRSILGPIEKTDTRFVRLGPGVSMRFPSS